MFPAMQPVVHVPHVAAPPPAAMLPGVQYFPYVCPPAGAMHPGVYFPHVAPPAAAMQPVVHVRPVMADNLRAEAALIKKFLRWHPFVAVDTEFPGTVCHPDRPYCLLTAKERYALLKANVDQLSILQLGLTLFDANGRLPVVGGVPVAWQFNFCDFDVRRDPHAPKSIQFLEEQGVDFDLIRKHGVSSKMFCRVLFSTGLLAQTWISFDGRNDFAYILKVLTGGEPLPETMDGFFSLMRHYFHDRVYDVKHMARHCPVDMSGGLRLVADRLGVRRPEPDVHQAGPDSLLTCRTFLEMRRRFFQNDGGAPHAGRLDALHS